MSFSPRTENDVSLYMEGRPQTDRLSAMTPRNWILHDAALSAKKSKRRDSSQEIGGMKAVTSLPTLPSAQEVKIALFRPATNLPKQSSSGSVARKISTRNAILAKERDFGSEAGSDAGSFLA